MSVSTKCYIFWVSLEDVVTERDHDPATCDSTLAACTIYSNSGDDSVAVTCDSTLYQSDFTSDEYAQYFCACGTNPLITVPETVNCADLCYNLHTDFPSCNWLTLDDGYTAGSGVVAVTEDLCVDFRCGPKGVRCTDSTGYLYLCDNIEHEVPYVTDSTDSYVCNCKGPAKIPELYQTDSQHTLGVGCLNEKDVARAASATASVAIPTQSVPNGASRSCSLKSVLLSVSLFLMLGLASW